MVAFRGSVEMGIKAGEKSQHSRVSHGPHIRIRFTIGPPFSGVLDKGKYEGRNRPAVNKIKFLELPRDDRAVWFNNHASPHVFRPSGTLVQTVVFNAWGWDKRIRWWAM